MICTKTFVNIYIYFYLYFFLLLKGLIFMYIINYIHIIFLIAGFKSIWWTRLASRGILCIEFSAVGAFVSNYKTKIFSPFFCYC